MIAYRSWSLDSQTPSAIPDGLHHGRVSPEVRGAMWQLRKPGSYLIQAYPNIEQHLTESSQHCPSPAWLDTGQAGDCRDTDDNVTDITWHRMTHSQNSVIQ